MRVLLIATIVSAVIGCGYRVGNIYGPEVRTVEVPEVAVIVALALPVPFAEAACAGALCMLIFSFAVDLRFIIAADRS